MEQEFEPKGKLKIRPATTNDAQALNTYCFPMLDAKEVEASLKDDVARMEKGEVFRFVVDAGGHAIANICLERHPLHPETVKVRDLAVSPPFRSLEVATELVTSMETVARSNGITNLSIELSSSDTKVIDGYKRWGFVERPVVILEKVVEIQQELLDGLKAGGDKDEE